VPSQGRNSPEIPPSSADGAPRRVAGGIVAYNDEHRIERSIRSLLGQQLPRGTEWSRIWVVASGCTDRTVEIARAVACEDSRLHVLAEERRRGKSAAVREVLRRAEGESLVLLNSDAIAAPGAVAALLARAAGRPTPHAVMARPVAPSTEGSGWASTMRWMWELHHEFHLEMLADGGGAHLSDEMMLVSLPALAWLEDGIINDGGYCAVWLQGHSGGCWYAPDAHVGIDTPSNLGEHLRQRRRIHVGNAQIAAALGRSPLTLLGGLLGRPRETFRALRRAVGRPGGMRHLAAIAACEGVAQAMALWDRMPPRRDHVHWARIDPPAPGRAIPRPVTNAAAPTEGPIERRARLVLEIAQEFGTTLSVAQVSELLPSTGAADAEVVREFLSRRPELASARLPTVGTEPDRSRVARAEQYRQSARAVVSGPLRWLARWIRCMGVTGSTAYGAPEPGDDLDFFVVARSAALPWLLLAVYGSLWWARRRGSLRSVPPLCFNYLVDERRTAREFGSGHGLLFAREVLTAEILSGEDYYRGILAATPALRDEFPRLYDERTRAPGPTDASRPTIGTKVLSALAYVPLATYLQLAGLLRNGRARSEHRDSDLFRTVTTFHRFAFESRRFEELRARYDRGAVGIPPAIGGPTAGRFPWSR